DRSGCHLAHHIAAMQFDGDSAGAEIERYLLVDTPARHVTADFPFARCEHVEAFDIKPRTRRVCARPGMHSDGGVYRIDHALISYRLGENVHHPSLHRLHRHRNVTVRRQETNRHWVSARDEMLLQLETACPRHANI